MDTRTALQTAGGGGGKPRKKGDFYPTPPDVTTALFHRLEHFFPPESNVIFDPAVGDGAICEVAKTFGYETSGSDVTDYGTPYHDFTTDFMDTKRSSYPMECVLVTNPPFVLAEKFIRHAWDLGLPFFFLLKIQYFSAQSRVKLFKDCPPELVMPCAWRASFDMSGKGGPMDVMWVGWDGEDSLVRRGVKLQSTHYSPLPKPKNVPTNRLEALL